MNCYAKQRRERRFILITTLVILLLLCIVYNIHLIQTYYYSNFSVSTKVTKKSYHDNTHLQFSLWLAEHVNTTTGTINSNLTIANTSSTTAAGSSSSSSNGIGKNNTKLSSSIDSSSVVNTTSFLTYTTQFQKKLDSIIVPTLWMKQNIQIRYYPIWNTVYNRSNDLPCYRPTLSSIFNTSLWCESKLNKIRSIPIKEGLFFVKLYKTASSTSASIHVRIAHNLANRIHNNHVNTVSNDGNDTDTKSIGNRNNTNDTISNEYWPVCRTRHLHGPAGTSTYKFHQRNKQYSFLWTMIRHPTERYISEFFHFEVSRHPTKQYSNNNISDDLLHYIRYGKHSNRHSIHYLSLSNERYTKKLQNDNITSSSNNKQLQNTIQTILDEYDFIGIMERFDESIVVLMLLLNIPMADVLYMSSKLNGGWDPYISDTNNAQQCTKIQPSILTNEVQEYITNSTDWYQYIEPENILYIAANEQLDKTIINTIGISKFQQTLQLYQSIQHYIQIKCTFNYTYTSYTCNPYNGTIVTNNNCIHTNTDIGCGFTCLDEIATEMKLW